MDKSLYLTQVKPAEEDKISVLPLDREKLRREMKVRLFQDDETRKKTLQYLSQLHTDADSSRDDKDWDIRHKQFNAMIAWRSDGQANTNMSIEQATIRNKMADELAQQPIINFIPTEPDDVYKTQMLKEIWDFVWTEADTDKELYELFLCKNIFGTGIWFEGLHKEIFTRYNPKIGNDGEIIGEPVVSVKTILRGVALDIRDVWIDPVYDIDLASYCFIRQTDVSEDALLNLKNDPNFDKDEIDAMLAQQNPRPHNEWGDHGGYTFTTRQERLDNVSKKYVLYHFFHKEKGIYIVVDETFTYILREGANPYPHGQLPISILVDHKRYREMYGRGECELLESTKYERNVVRNQIISYVRESNTMNFAVGSGVSFQKSEMLSGVMRMWNFKGNLTEAQFLKPQPMDNGLWNLDSMLQADATWITGIDNNSLVGDPSKTAFQARLQEQTKLKGIFMSLRLADFFYVRMARQRLANIQFFLPTTTGKTILGAKMKSTNQNRTIALPDKSMKPFLKYDTKAKQMVEAAYTFDKAPGETAFLELKPQMIQSGHDVEVVTPTTTPILRELNKYELETIFQTLIQLAATPDGAALLKDFDFKKYFRDLVREKGFDPDDYIKDQGQEDKTKQMRAEAMAGVPLPPKVPQQPGADPMQTMMRSVLSGGIAQPGQAPGSPGAPAKPAAAAPARQSLLPANAQ